MKTGGFMKHRLMSLVIILGISFSITSCSNSKKSIIRNTSSTTPITDFFSKTSIPATEEAKPEETKPEETKPENEDECKAKNRISAKRLKRYPKTFEEYDFRKVIFDNVYLDSGTKLSHMIIEGFYDIAFIKFWVHPPNNGSTFNIFVGSDGELYYGGFPDDCLLISEKELFEDIPEIGLEYIERYMN